MKKIFTLTLLLSLSALADTNDTVSVAQALTGSAPTLATQGLSLAGATGYRVVLSAEATRTLSGGGSLLCYFYAETDAAGTRRWTRCPSYLDLTTITSGSRDWLGGDFLVPVGGGRVFYMPSSVTVSSGSTVTVTLTARRK